MLIVLILLSSVVPTLSLVHLVHPATASWPTQPTQVTNNSSTHLTPSVAQDMKGNVYLFWDQNPGIYYTITNPANIANNVWPSPSLYTKTGQADYSPSVVALKNGTILLFLGRRSSLGWNIYNARYNNGQWSSETLIESLPPAPQGPSPSAIQDNSGKIWLAFTKNENGDLKLKFVNATNNPTESWATGKAIVYDTNNNGVYDTGEPVIYGTAPAKGTPLKNDSRLKFVDSNGDGVWEPGEFVLYDANQDNLFDPKLGFIDSNNNNVWDPGETIVYDADSDGLYTIHTGVNTCTVANLANDCVIAGTRPSLNNTIIKTDPHIKFTDPDSDSVWQPGDTLVYDTNNNGQYDTGEPTITQLASDQRLRFIGSGSTWVSGNTVVYDSNNNTRYDSSIKFVDTNGNGHWDPGETVVYDTNLNGFYDLSDTVIFEAQPLGHDLGKPLTNDPGLKFVDTNGDGLWEPGEPVVYDSNLNSIYDGKIKFVDSNALGHWVQGEAVIFDTDNNGIYTFGKFHNDTIIAGPTPANNTILKTDPLIKFYDKNGSGVYTPGELVVYDTSNIGIYDGEVTIAGTTPALNAAVKTDSRIMFVNATKSPSETWSQGKTVIYDPDGDGKYVTGRFTNDTVIAGTAPVNQTALKFDPSIKFVNATTNPAETWAQGKSVVYVPDGTNRYDAEPLIAGQAPLPLTGITTGLGEPVVSAGAPPAGSILKTDPKVKFIDNFPYNGVWDPPSDVGPGEDIIYDVNNTGTYRSGDPIIFSNGTLPAPGALLSTDPHIKFVDSNNNSIWDSNEAVVYDGLFHGTFDSRVSVISGIIPRPNSPLTISIGEPVIVGSTPAPGTNLKSDLKIRFVDLNGNGHWVPADPVAYDTNGDGIFDTGDIAISGSPLPSPGTLLKIDETVLYGTTVSNNTSLSIDTGIRYVNATSSPSETWSQGKTVIYDPDGDGKYITGRFTNDTIVSGVAPANNTKVSNDPKLKYVESNSDTHWEMGETVAYDTNSTGHYVSGDPIVAAFPAPSTGTALKTDSHIKYFDTDGNKIWDPGESVVYDANGNGAYDAGETVIYGPTPATGTVLATDSLIKFVDSNGDTVWERGEPVVYDANNNNIYDSGETVIAGPLPALGSAVRVVAHIFYKIYNGASWSADQRVTSLPTGDHSPSLTQTVDGRVWVTWSADRNLPTEVLYKTTANGNVWTPEVLLYTGSTGDTNPAIVQDRNGTIWFVWGHNLPCSSCGSGVTFQVDLYSSNSVDNGATWSSPVDLTQNCTNCSTTDEVYPSLVQLSDKKLYIFFTIINSSAATVNLYYMSSLISPIHDGRMNGATGSTVNLRATQTYTLRANVTNSGDYNDTLTTTLMANNTWVASNSTLVRAGQTVQIVVNWVVKVRPGTYVISTIVSDPGESLANQADNTGTVPNSLLIRPAGDVNGDCVVNITDLVIVAASFGKSVGDPGYNPIADLNSDGSIAIDDLTIVGGTFAQTC